MRVLFWTHSFWPAIGGTEIFAARLLPALQERGHEIIVATSQGSPDQPLEARYKGIPIHRFPFKDVNSYTAIDQLMETRKRVAGLKRTFAPDLVHVNHAADLSTFFHLTTAATHPAPLLVTLHGMSTHPNSLLEHTLCAADWVVGCSTAVLARGQQLVPAIIPRSSIIYNGLEPPAFPPSPPPTAAPRVLCLGRLSPEKGLDVAVAAFSLIVTRFPRARLVIAGDGPSKTDLERQTADLKVSEVVDFIGWIAYERVPLLLNTATLVVLPSRSEGFPLVALEAALMARPIVATGVGGLPEVVEHEKTGLLVEPEDPPALAEAIASLLDRPQSALAMGRAARSRALEAFSWERHVGAYDSLYHTLVTEWRRKSAPAPGARSTARVQRIG